MASFLIIIGLIFEIIGVSIIVYDELKVYEAIIRQRNSKPTGWWWVQFTFWLAKKSGSLDPKDQESYIGETYPKRLLGFICLLVGFIFQTISVLLLI
jgi:hypothetical protein